MSKPKLFRIRNRNGTDRWVCRLGNYVGAGRCPETAFNTLQAVLKLIKGSGL